MIFLNWFLATVALVLGLVIATAAVIGFLVVAYAGKQMYDEKRRTVWKNEPPIHRS
jgi:uncharacterized integral membrane protein